MAQSGGINNPWVTNNMSICLDLSLAANLTLSVWAKEFADELHATDGVFLSAPGVSATKIISFVSDFSVYREFTTDLEAAITAAGITDRSRVTILLQQYDNAPLGNDGIAFDDFSVSGLGAITVCP